MFKLDPQKSNFNLYFVYDFICHESRHISIDNDVNSLKIYECFMRILDLTCNMDEV